jgi:hypothetical protein
VTERDQEEQDLRIELMSVHLEQAKKSIERMQQELRTDNRKFLVQFVIAISAAVGVGIAIGRFIFFHN